MPVGQRPRKRGAHIHTRRRLAYGLAAFFLSVPNGNFLGRKIVFLGTKYIKCTQNVIFCCEKFCSIKIFA